MQVEQISVERLIPYARNSRTHSDAQVAQIAASIREFGFTNPILAGSDGVIVAGHGRLAAAQKLGLPTVPVVVLDHLTPTQRRALVIADNRIAENAGWDEEMLKLEMVELDGMGYDISLAGFGQDEIDAILAPARNAGLTDPDAVPPAPTSPVTRLGDVWVLGRHRIICGDSTSATDVDRLLAGVKPHLMVTDPPYGVEYDPKWRQERGVSDGGAMGEVLNDDRADWREAWALFPGDVAYVWHGMKQSPIIVESLEACGFELRAEIVWAKSRLVISRGHYHSQHESCWYAVRKGATGHWAGDRKQTTLWEIAHNKSETGHGTQKPIECMRRPIENNSSPGQAIYEPFSGSGTTIIAAEQTGRCCYAAELSPAYVDVAVERWQDFTGGGAVLEGDGRTFNEVAQDETRACA